ncbi:MAG: CotH kinase family protein [Sphingobacteriales bacterium]|nr:CotH kinase family protein [Sphingobacteriales bacterium]
MIESDPEQDVYYTTDGSEPTSRSKRYQEPVIINSSQMIKAVAYSRTCLPSEVVERTYLFEKKPSLPVVFLTGNVGDWFSVERGIYEKGMYAEPQPPHHGANFWQDWTIPVFFEWLDEKGDLRFHQKAGAKIHGAGSRAFDMKSLQIKALGGLYGNRFKFSFFPQQAQKSYRNVLLKNSGQNFKLSHLNDPLIHELIAPLGTVDVQQYRPVVVYINGRYWGIHDLRDKADKYYLAEKYGIKAKSVEIVEGCGLEAVDGTTEHFRAMRDYIFNNDLSALQHYEWVKAHLNIENFCDYMITNLYVVNKDWHQSGNVRAWRSPEYDGGRWHFFLTDLDISMGHIGMAGENNLMEIFNANSPQAKMLKMLLQNPDFKKYFTQRFNDLLNSTFAPEHVLATLERLAAQLEPEMPRHCGRWGMSVVEWKEKYVGEIVTFAKLRTAIIRRYLREQLLLGSEIKMVSSVEPPASGSIAINTYFPTQYPFTGIYFSAQNIDLNAYPAEGYRFAYWELGNSRIKESCVSVPLRDSSVVKAHFEKQ